MRLKDVVEKWAEFVRRLAIHRYGRAPDIRLSGHVGSTFPYITLPLGKDWPFFYLFFLSFFFLSSTDWCHVSVSIDYILPEIFKNAVRATIESHPDASETSLPSVHVTIANNEVDFILR